MSTEVRGARDGDWLAQCDKCGAMNYASMMTWAPTQAAGGGPSGFWVCRRHKVQHHLGNDLGEMMLSLGQDPEPVPVARPFKATNNTDQSAVPEPVITSISPSTATAAGFAAAPNLTVNGTGFSASFPTSRVRWDGAIMATTYVSATQLTAVVLAGLCTVGTHVVTVENVPPPLPDDSSWLDPDNISDGSNMVLT